jgi:hypothetical protein
VPIADTIRKHTRGLPLRSKVSMSRALIEAVLAPESSLASRIHLDVDLARSTQPTTGIASPDCGTKRAERSRARDMEGRASAGITPTILVSRARRF